MPPPDKNQSWLSQNIPLPYVLLFLGLGSGGSGLVGHFTRSGDLSELQPIIKTAVAEELAKDQDRLDELLKEVGSLHAEIRDLREEVRDLRKESP